MHDQTEANAPLIGPVIQRQRKARGLSLEKLATLSGVSKSMLSQIERGQANPTFAVLWSLTRALKIEFADLVDGAPTITEKEPNEIVTAGHTPEIKSPDGVCRLRILSPPRLAGETEWYELEIEPGGVLDSAAHADGAVEHLTILAGSFEVTSGEAVRTVETGETARYPVDVPHRIRNTATGISKALMVLLYR